MESKKQRHILSGTKYDALFPAAMLKDETVKRGATVNDTVKLIPKIVHDTLNHTRRLVLLLEADNLYSTCRNIWNFVYNHIRYNKDEEGREQVRSPARAWHDRFRGVDCDCYTVFISSVLTHLKIPHKLRITKYGGKNFQHIYPVVPCGNGHITIDCVVEQFNYEEPYTEKQDTTMELQYLNGFENSDYNDLDKEGDFGRLFKRRNKTDGEGKKKRTKLGTFLHKGLNIVNKLNPATALLRNGVLAAMKLNMFKIGQRLKWAYLSEADARKKGVDLDKWKRLVKVREKMEKIFFDAGGKEENLKKAILKGKGNKNNEVSGLLGYAPTEADFYLTTDTPLRKVLGEEIWQDENVSGLEGFEEVAGIGALGEVATGAAIASATTVLAAIGGLLKSIGNIFPKKQKETEDFENTETEDNAAIQQAATNSSSSPLPAIDSKTNLPATTSENTETVVADEKSSTTDTNTDSGDDKPAGFWDKNKKWLKPTLFGVGGLGLLYLGYRMLSGKKKTDARTTTTPKQGKELSGLEGNKTPAKKKVKLVSRKNNKSKTTHKPENKKKPVALL